MPKKLPVLEEIIAKTRIQQAQAAIKIIAIQKSNRTA
jgi:hypothetical protein